jgi:desulfoferrodoxin (superoxide reductase-like protein)
MYDEKGEAIMKNKGIAFLGLAVVLLGAPAASFGNKSSVEIEAPQAAEEGSEIVIKIHVFHKGNSFIHYTNWVDVKINGKPFQRWEFSSSKRPEAEDFTIEVTYKLTEPITVVAEANCNTHGSEGPSTWTVTLASEENEP